MMDFDTVGILIADDNEEAVSEALGSGQSVPVNDEDGTTLLMWAARIGRPRMVELLVTLGVDVNAQSHAGLTAAMIAITMARLDVLKTLVNKGARLDLRDAKGHTAMDYAVMWDRREIMDFLKSISA